MTPDPQIGRALRRRANAMEQASLRALGEFEVTRPTPTRQESDLLSGEAHTFTALKIWDLSPINQAAPDPTEPGPWEKRCERTHIFSWLEVLQHGGTPIPGAAGTSYTPVVGDIGADIGLRVTATNAGGVETAEAQPVGPVEP